MAPATVAFDARYVNDQYHGIGRHAFVLLEALTRLNPGRRYLLCYDPTQPNTRFDLASLGHRPNVTLRPIRLRLHSPLEQLFWPALLAAARASLFHTPYVALPVLSPVPLVMTVHDLIFERFPEYMPERHLRLLYRALTGLGVGRAAAVLTVSAATREDVERYYRVPPERLHVVGNALGPGFGRETDRSRLAAVRRRYGLPERFMLTLGAGRPHKNVALVVEALARLDPRLAPHLVVAGEPDRRFGDGVSAAVSAHGLDGRVVRPGRIDEADLPALYSLADLFVFPSLVEGFGLPPLEAMACGTPVVASNASSIPEVVGEGALLFDPRDAGDLADKVVRLAADGALRADLVARGAERARQFTPERTAGAVLETYRRVIGAA
jgi:glycosyltransferase involved in cell wall biosynthesis